jgi:methionyl-tRNA synthetase
LKVDTGIDVRTIVSELQRVLNQDIVKKNCFSEFARNLRGVESQGMILMTTNAEENWF